MDKVEMRRLRKEAGLTQLELANKIGVSLGTLQRLEEGKNPMTKRHRVALEHALIPPKKEETTSISINIILPATLKDALIEIAKSMSVEIKEAQQ